MLLKEKTAAKILQSQMRIINRSMLWSKPTIFLCGGFNSHRRDILARYIRTHKKWPVFYAEDVWSYLAQSEDNALGMENKLGEFSDVIIIIAESPGTFAEIGAFANVEKLRKKLLVIIDKEYKNQQSFLSTGPITWINRDSMYGETLYVDFTTFIMCSEQVISRIKDGFSKTKKTWSTSFLSDLSDVELIYLISDIIAIFGPCDADDIKNIINRLREEVDERFDRLLATGLSMNFYRHVNTSKGNVFYYHSDDGIAPSTTYFINPLKNRLKYIAKALKDQTIVSVFQEVYGVS